MPKQKKLRLGPDEYVVTAYAERANGPGWANQPIWVLIGMRGTNDVRRECIQPEHHTPAMGWLYTICEQAHLSMVAAVNQIVVKSK
jgi:hypothetical protein